MGVEGAGLGFSGAPRVRAGLYFGDIAVSRRRARVGGGR